MKTAYQAADAILSEEEDAELGAWTLDELDDAELSAARWQDDDHTG